MLRFQLFSKITIPALIVIVLISCANNSGSSTASSATAAKDTIPTASNNDPSIPGSFSTQTQLTFDSTEIKKFLDNFPSFKIFEKDMYSFYQTRNFACAWYDENGLIETAGNLYNRIENIGEEGLPDKVPYKEKFTELIETASADSKPSTSLELMLTSQYLLYAKNVWQGINEKQSQAIEWLLPRKKLSYRQLLDSLSGNNILKNEPQYRQYHLLKADIVTLAEIHEEDIKLKYEALKATNKKEFTIDENIFYEVGKSHVQASSKLVLDKVTKILEEEPNVQLVVISHTDAQGDEKSNLLLSEKRALDVIDYLIVTGISSKRLKAIGKGEREIRNRCFNDVNCSAKEHEYNRRTEFKFIRP